MNKILIIAPTPFFTHRGTPIRIYEEALALVKFGHQIKILTYHLGETPDFSGFNITIERIRPLASWYHKTSSGASWTKFLLDWQLLLLTIKTIKSWQPDIIHAHLHEGVTIGHWANKISGQTIPLLGDFHGSLTTEILQQKFFPLSLKSWLERIESTINHWPDTAICSSPEYQSHLNHAQVINDGVNLEQYNLPIDQAQILQKYKLPHDKRLVIYTGAFNTEKGIELLIEAIKIINQNTHTWHFIFAGRGKQVWIDKITQIPNCTLINELDYFSLPEILKVCHLAIDPKKTESKQGTGKLLAYLAAGLPIIAFERPSNRYYLGEKYPLAEEMTSASLARQIEKINNSSLKHPELSIWCKQRAENFSWEKSAKKITEIYTQIKQNRLPIVKNLFLHKISKGWRTIKEQGIITGGKRVFQALLITIKPLQRANILFITGGVGDSARYRCWHQAEEHEMRGIKCEVCTQDSPFLFNVANRYQKFVFHRVVYTAKIAKLVNQIKKQNKEIIYDTDDLVFNPQQNANIDYLNNMNPWERNLYQKGIGQEFLKDPYIKTCTVTTKYLADILVNQFKKEVIIAKNRLSIKDFKTVDNLIAKPRISDKIVKVGYFSGSHSHNKDFAIVSETLLKILNQYPQVKLIIAGPVDIDIRFNNFADRIVRLPFVSREKHFANLYDIDINIIPLELNNPFCEAKSEIKWLEAGILAIPSIATANQTYSSCIQDGVNGYLATTTQDWEVKLKELICKQSLRIEIGKKARQSILTDYKASTISPVIQSTNNNFMRYLINQIHKYKELIWMLAKTDFKVRYQGSALGYLWSLLQPFLMFLIIYFVFSQFKGLATDTYALELLVSIMIFQFFVEGTSAGMVSLKRKAGIITKIYIPKWAIIFSATLNSLMVFGLNLIVIFIFFAFNHYLPSLTSIGLSILFIILTYLLIISFSFITATLYVRFKDLDNIWDVITRALFYATPIFFPLSIFPIKLQPYILANPMGFIVHFNKTALFEKHFPDPWQLATFVLINIAVFILSIFLYKKTKNKITELL